MAHHIVFIYCSYSTTLAEHEWVTFHVSAMVKICQTVLFPGSTGVFLCSERMLDDKGAATLELLSLGKQTLEEKTAVIFFSLLLFFISLNFPPAWGEDWPGSCSCMTRPGRPGQCRTADRWGSGRAPCRPLGWRPALGRIRSQTQSYLGAISDISYGCSYPPFCFKSLTVKTLPENLQHSTTNVVPHNYVENVECLVA